jgi:hypothetical protein
MVLVEALAAEVRIEHADMTEVSARLLPPRI